MHKTTLAVIVFAAFSGAAWAAGQAGAAGQSGSMGSGTMGGSAGMSGAHQDFSSLDKNGDRNISKSEAQAQNLSSSDFDRADRDQNGVLSQDEWQSLSGTPGSATSPAGTGTTE